MWLRCIIGECELKLRDVDDLKKHCETKHYDFFSLFCKMM